MINHLNAEYLLNKVWKFSSYVTENTLRLWREAEPINAA